MKQKSWYYRPTAGHETHRQGVVADEATGRDVAVVYDGDADGMLLASAPEMLALLEKMAAGMTVSGRKHYGIDDMIRKAGGGQ